MSAGRDRPTRGNGPAPCLASRRAAIPVALLLAIAVTSGCATVRGGSGPSRSATALGWGDFTLGMSLEEVRARAGGGELEVRRIEDACGEAGARLVRDGRELFLGFSGDDPAATLQTIVRRLPPDPSREEVVRDLQRRFPDLRYRPDPRWPNMPEEENPKPLYVHPDLPDQGILVGVEEGFMWISYLRCLD